jgi:ParB family transcriptional regulator, chromosome partitioning protein
MKRTISRSLISKALDAQAEASEAMRPDDGEQPSEIKPVPKPIQRAASGAGSAWKSGALAQTQATLDQGRAQIVSDILAGRHELSILPKQVSDPLGSDRRPDWMEQDAFQALLNSIGSNGQDTPILVRPVDGKWSPDPLDPTNVESVQFVMLTGRRRHAVAEQLGIPLRAILVQTNNPEVDTDKFEMLFLRFRENEEREDLSAFERLLSIGEMFDALSSSSSGKKLTAVAFAERIGVHESIISRARAVFHSKDEILNAFKNVYELSFKDIQNALASLSAHSKAGPKPKTKPKKMTTVRKIGNHKLSVSSLNGKLSISAAGVKIDKKRLEGLGDLIADYLQKQGVDYEA